MANKNFAQWCSDVKNIQGNLKIVMWNGVKIPVSNLMCPICNGKNTLADLKKQTLIDPDCNGEYTQQLIHQCHGWSNCSLAIKDNIVYHQECLEKKYKRKFAKMVKNGDILVENPPLEA